jgi:hypothetical protein
VAAGCDTADESQRAGALHSKAINYLHTVLGPKREFALAALNRLIEHRLRDFVNNGPFPESLTEKLSVIFPEKCAYLGKDRMQMLIESATTVAAQHGLKDEAAPVLLTILMILLGHQVDRDPISPWVEGILRDTAFMETSIRMETLEKKTWEKLEDGMGRFT